MKLTAFHRFCMEFNGTEETYPFTGESAWFKVGGKLFAMTNIKPFRMRGEIVEPFHFINLKCEPSRAINLREEHEAISPAWHQNKKHWNTLLMDESLADKLIKELVRHSYDLVYASLSNTVCNTLTENIAHEQSL